MFWIFLMNFIFAISTTIGMTIIPLITTESLGLSLFVLGMIEGSTEFLSNILRLVTGNIFDRIKDKRYLFVSPAIIALVSKAGLLFPNISAVLLSKTFERISNGAFAAPRDAYIGVNAKNKGMALAFLNISKTLGCILGPLLVSGCTLYFGALKENIYKVIILACFFNMIAVLVSFFIKSENVKVVIKSDDFSMSNLKHALGSSSNILTLAFIFFLGRFNDGVILLYLKNQGFPEWFYLSTISLFNLAMLCLSPIFGYYIDKAMDRTILLLTILSLIGFNIVFYNIASAPWLFAIIGLILWGAQRVGSQMSFTAMIFRNTPSKYRGTSIGVYSFLSGAGILISSFICGYLAQKSFGYVFITSGICSIFALLFALYSKKIKV